MEGLLFKSLKGSDNIRKKMNTCILLKKELLKGPENPLITIKAAQLATAVAVQEHLQTSFSKFLFRVEGRFYFRTSYLEILLFL